MKTDAIRAGNHNADSLLGNTIEGKYRLASKLGTGGMGTVYLATRLMIGDTVAVKILHDQQVSDPQALERFRREAQAAARLKHQNAVAIYDFGVSNEGLVYLVMELAEGQSLRDIITQQGPITTSATAEIMNQVCAALDAAHRQNIVHRDLKPDNIIVAVTDTALHAKVLDFGIAKMRDLTVSNLTQTGSVMGTPHYMSPEHCMGEELDHRSDIYSLGIVLFEMLAGVVPFNSPTPTAVIVQHVNQAPPSLRALNASIPPAVEAVVMHALEKRREARPQTAVHLAQELMAAVQGSPFTSPSGSMPARPFYSTPSSTTPASNLIAGAELAATIQMTPPPVISGVQTAIPAKNRLPLKLGVAVVIVMAAIVLALLVWSQRKKTAAPAMIAGAAPPPPLGMAYVRGSEFTMGNDAGDESEKPQHKVMVKPFFIDLYEVTCEEYEKFIRATKRRPPATWASGHYPSGWERRPITGINWDDANAYAEWAGKRLPTEEEWELAARGADGRLYPWGSEWKKGLANAGPTSLGHVIAVGTYSAGVSPFGAVDMVGNAWEWTASDFVAYPGGTLPGQATSTLKVIRGGCFLSRTDQATVTIRVGWPARGGNEYDNTGFRCAKDPPATSQPVEASVATSDDLLNFSKNFAGIMGDKFKIEMRLQRNGENLSGSYFFQPVRDAMLHGNYTRVPERWADKNNALARIDVLIKGTVDNQQNFIVEEFDDKGLKTGIFTGHFVSDAGMEGMWSKPNGKSQTPFSLKDEGDKASGGNYRIISKVSRRKTGKIKVDVSYPQLEGLADEDVQKTFNERVQALVTKDIGGFSNGEGEHGGSFSVEHRSGALLSVVFGAYDEWPGAAHGQSHEFSYHYDLSRNKELKLSDFFLPGVNHLSLLAKLCAKDIAKQKRKNGMEDIYADGEVAAFNALKEDATFYPTATGLVFIFDPYQVGSYAEGYYVVALPYAQLRSIINPDGPLAPFVS
ncbi:MAG: SUMF1/EgtB/PvdO family nonheme iron enzyme [Acidobacteria bacterium]|nr:SUMF1/EgtB/PvdO family nonheme iron enzyme [Acidobacteriota bacterium]